MEKLKLWQHWAIWFIITLIIGGIGILQENAIHDWKPTDYDMAVGNTGPGEGFDVIIMAWFLIGGVYFLFNVLLTLAAIWDELSNKKNNFM